MLHSVRQPLSSPGRNCRSSLTPIVSRSGGWDYCPASFHFTPCASPICSTRAALPRRPQDREKLIADSGPQRAVRRLKTLCCGSPKALRVSADPVAKPAAHTRAESRGSRPSKADAGERQTLRWREMDSNHRYRIRNNPFSCGRATRTRSSCATSDALLPSRPAHDRLQAGMRKALSPRCARPEPGVTRLSS
jgi:hypothetical protein